MEQAIQQCTVIPADTAVAKHWAKLQNKFRDQIGTNDLWIAACALVHNPVLPIATGNLKHFQPISNTFGIPLVHPDLS